MRSLQGLGIGPLVLVPHGQPTLRRPFITRSRPLPFSLPAHAHEGGDEWFVMRLHFRLELAPDSGSGLIDVSASTDGGWSSDMIEIHVQRVGRTTRLDWSKVGLIAGAVNGHVAGRSVELADSNIMIMRGVRPGVNTMQFEVRSSENARVRRVTIYPDSGVYFTSSGPGTLQLHLSASPGPQLRVGQTLHVRMSLRDPNPRPVRRVNLALSFDKKYFQLLNPPVPTQIRVVARARPYRHTFDLRALSVGRSTINLVTQSVNASPTANVTPTIVAAGGFRWGTWLPVITLVAGAILLGVGRHIKMTRPSRAQIGTK